MNQNEKLPQPEATCPVCKKVNILGFQGYVVCEKCKTILTPSDMEDEKLAKKIFGTGTTKSKYWEQTE